MKWQMTPQEIFEYKNKWKPNGYRVPVHSDLDVQCKDWCRRNCERWEWSMTTWTNVYEHTFMFEHEDHYATFSKTFEKWVQTMKETA